MSTYKIFKQRLDEEHHWPAVYMFKFVVPRDKEQDVLDLFPEENLTSKISKKGKYISFTLQKVMQSSDQVIEIYEEAHKIEGIIAL